MSRGLENQVKRRMVAEVIRDCKADIVCLEETKITTPKINILNSLGRKFTFIIHPSRGDLGGIMIGVNINKFDIIDHIVGNTPYR